jgi:hypothetical protein
VQPPAADLRAHLGPSVFADHGRNKVNFLPRAAAAQLVSLRLYPAAARPAGRADRRSADIRCGSTVKLR